ncbi:hypothetical protein [Pelovirga terrestris]|uniref:Doubled CXXCH motif domain-containing protein n=1 Tax=Pelovirga terrestris TaxID=2771352 RepID=A0A8J6R5V1_9BACT|nr:hypothetical protein [Pelovirga terrestris]MBD1400674.1 hypothetical protein [Pelovirga terrestris]
MRKLLVFALVATFAFGATALVATDADARAMANGIVGSAHDFTNNRDGSVALDAENNLIPNRDESWNYRGEICRVCHAPHDKGRTAWSSWGEEVGETGLLWNHALSQTADYPMYASSSLEGEISNQVIGKSKLCLSCHDGTVALNAFDGQQDKPATDPDAVLIQSFSNGFTIGPGRTGSDNDFLMGTHPISVAYAAGFYDENPKVGRNGGLHIPDGQVFGNLVKMTGAPTVDMVLEQGMVQCHSCHDVHDSKDVNAVGTRLNRAGQGLAENRGGDPSGLCLSCHNK